MKLLVAAAILSSSTAALAGDSSWLLCKGIGEQAGKPVTKTYFAASVLEHRGAAGDARDLDVTLLYGAHASRGIIASATAKPGALSTKLVDKKTPVSFTGTGALSADMKTFALSGKLDASYGDDPKAAPVGFTAKLTCELLDDQAIGH